ncbi:MAG: NAD-dependent protein deacetylase [Pseudomonadota bacterium]
MKAVQALAQAIDRCDGALVAVTGAGLSTASGIGDYRDREGNYKRPPPVTISAFTASHAARQRYWARSLYGWPAFAAARPNAAHAAVARLEHAGMLAHTITQNVDGLHQAAGTRALTELHGNLRWVHCMECAATVEREVFQSELRGRNEQLLGLRATPAPDGDADLQDAQLDAVQVPDCAVCGGLLKPAVVFFGDTVPAPVVSAAYEQVDAARGLLVLGSSVMIHSSFRFCRRAKERGIPIYAVNLGRTRADEWLSMKLEAPCEEVLPGLCDVLGLPSGGNFVGVADL